MLKSLLAFWNVFLYANIFIALCALALFIQSSLLVGIALDIPLLVFVFFSTHAIYALHRLISLQKLDEELLNGRFLAIQKLKPLILGSLIVSSIGALICCFFLNWKCQLALVLPIILALGYVLPIWKGNRLRDVPLLKIFLIAAVWTFMTAALPLLEEGKPVDLFGLLLLAERAVFVFAITIPFDIRDQDIESFNKVPTIPSLIGIQNSKLLSLALLLAWLAICFFIYPIAAFTLQLVLALGTAYLVWGANKSKPDYYYTALLDGTMLLQGLVVSLAIIYC